LTKVLYHEEEGVSWITLNRPEKLNALDGEAWRLLGDALRRGNEADTIALVVSGSGRAFSSGDDIEAMLQADTPEKAEDFFNNLWYAVDSLFHVKKPVIGAVNGLAYGGGCELLFLMDVVVAVEGAKFSIPEGKLGLIPPMALTIGYRAMGRPVAWLMLTSEVIDSLRAKELGLVDYVVKEGELREAVRGIVKKITGLDQMSIRVMKTWLSRERQGIREAVRELTLMNLSKEARDRMRDFLERRLRESS
jgi:enoyl-CoA hydratase/carnithine racemase